MPQGELRLQAVLVAALRHGDVVGARRGLATVTQPSGVYVRLAEAAVRLAEGDEAGARVALGEWRVFVEGSQNPGFTRIGNHWAEEMLTARLGG